jgi:hypothetical protein
MLVFNPSFFACAAKQDDTLRTASKGGYFDPTKMDSFTAPPTPRPNAVMPGASQGAQTRGGVMNALNGVEQSTVSP